MACEDQISSQDLENAKTDATTLGEVATSRSGAVSTGDLIDTTENRLGETTDTVTGRLKKMGFAVPIVYAGGISFTINDNVKTVDEGGIISAPLPSALPFTTSGTWVGDDEDKFFTVQGLTNDQLINDLSQAYEFETVAEMVLDEDLPVNKAMITKVHNTTSNDGGSRYIKRAGASPEPVGSPDMAGGGYAELSIDSFVNIKQLGAIGDGTQSTTTFHEAASLYAKVVRFPTDNGEVYEYGSIPALEDHTTSYIDKYSSVTGILPKQAGFILEPVQLASGTVGNDNVNINWVYDGSPVSISLAGFSLREHCVIYHPQKRTYYLIADVLADASPYWPATYDSEIGLFKCDDPETMASWTYLGICIEKGTGQGQGEFGVASPAGAAVMDDGTIVVPFSSRDSGAPDFTDRTVGLAYSTTNPDSLPWTKRAGKISDDGVLRNDDPAIVRDPQTSVYHLFNRYVFASTYLIAHYYSTDPINGEWVRTGDANDTSSFTIDAQEVTAAFVLDGVCNLWCMEQGGALPPNKTAWWKNTSNMSEFVPKDTLERHLPDAAFGQALGDIFQNGHATPVVRDGVYRGTSFTVDDGGSSYNIQLEILEVENTIKLVRAGQDVGQAFPDGVNTTVIYEKYFYDTTGSPSWYDNTTGIFTPLIEGWYDFTASLNLLAVPDGSRLIMELRKNGVRVAGLHMNTTGAAADHNLSGNSGVVYADGVTDTFEISVIHVGGGALTSASDDTWNYFSMELVEAIV